MELIFKVHLQLESDYFYIFNVKFLQKWSLDYLNLIVLVVFSLELPELWNVTDLKLR